MATTRSQRGRRSSRSRSPAAAPKEAASWVMPAAVWFVSCIVFNWSSKTASGVHAGATPAVLTAAQFGSCVVLGSVAQSWMRYGTPFSSPCASCRSTLWVFSV